MAKATHLKPDEWEVLSCIWFSGHKHYKVELTNFINIRIVYTPYKCHVGQVLALPKLD